MRKPYLILFILLGVSLGNNLYAQTILKGKVISLHDGLVLSGANIKLNSTGCATDENGMFEIISEQGDFQLEVSFLGYKKFKEIITLNRGTNTIEIKLKKTFFTVETVEISAQGFQSEEMRSAARIQKISQKEIGAIPAQKLEGILQYATGVDVDNTLGMFSDKAVVSMRGMGGDNQGRVLVMIDGVPINKSDGGSVNWNAINIANIKDVQIIQGAASTLYGANAMGGAIDIRT